MTPVPVGQELKVRFEICRRWVLALPKGSKERCRYPFGFSGPGWPQHTAPSRDS